MSERERTSRLTRQRRVILEMVRGSRSHPTAEEVYAAVRKALPSISLATVYRNLDLLVARGLVWRLDFGEGSRRYDGNVGEAHRHGRCLVCGEVVDLPESMVRRLDYVPVTASGFRVVRHALSLEGYCGRCVSSGAAPQTGEHEGGGSAAAGWSA